MLAMYCKDAEERGVGLLTAPTIRAMDCSPSARLSDDSGSEREDSGVESMNDDDDDGDDSISAQSDTQNSNEHAISDDNNEQQVFM